jgi:hypothetical protein
VRARRAHWAPSTPWEELRDILKHKLFKVRRYPLRRALQLTLIY